LWSLIVHSYTPRDVVTIDKTGVKLPIHTGKGLLVYEAVMFSLSIIWFTKPFKVTIKTFLFILSVLLMFSFHTIPK
jgi:hypothetical protein